MNPTKRCANLSASKSGSAATNSVVRLEFAARPPDPSIRETLRERFGLSPLDIYDLPGELDYTSLFQISGLPLPALREPAWSPLAFGGHRGGCHDIFAAIRAGDVLVHHPYDSFEDSVERFIAAAAIDPETVAVKMTAYRIGDDTPFVKSLVKAAEGGKQVACVIEIKARFDEERNLHWAAELERAGAHVTFGVQGLKTHAKLALVVRKEASGLRSYVHIGTGNLPRAQSARLYADIGLFTCNPAITGDVINLFHYLTGRSQAPICRELLVAPLTMRPRLLDLIQREIAYKRANLPARILAKMNQLEDPEMIEALCEAASAGVPVDLIVRGSAAFDQECQVAPKAYDPVHYRTVPGTFPNLPFRRCARRPGTWRILHRLSRLDASESFQAD